MKNKFTTLLVFVSLIHFGAIQSQTLNVPGGTGGIGSSTNANVGIGTITPLTKLDISGNNMFLSGHNGNPQYIANWAPAGVWGFGSLENGKNTIRLGAINYPDMTWNAAMSCNLEVGGSYLYLSQHNGNPQYIANWKSAGLWGIGALDDERNTIRIGAINYPDMTWNPSLTCNIEIQGGLNVTANVGIGTTIPDQKLTVKGKIHAEEVIVDLNVPVADYVFKPTYKLMPLHEVEQFVKINSHLPEIPSATEITKNGLSMGEMQNKLLQKVEELTLYAIQQNKKIETLEKEIKELRTK